MAWDLLQEDGEDHSDQNDDDEKVEADVDSDSQQRNNAAVVDGFVSEDYMDDEQLQRLLKQLEKEHKMEQAEHRSDRRSQWQKQASERLICKMIQALEGGHEHQKNVASNEDFNQLLVEQYQALKEVGVQL